MSARSKVGNYPGKKQFDPVYPSFTPILGKILVYHFGSCLKLEVTDTVIEHPMSPGPSSAELPLILIS